MRHTSWIGQPKPVPLLPPGVVFPAALGLLVPATRLPHRLTTRLPAASARAVPLPAIAVRAHHHLASTSVAAQQSSVVRRPAASPTDRRARCDSSLEALYSWVCGARPPWRQRARLLHRFGPAADFFSAADYRPTLYPPRLFQNLTTDLNSSTTITLVRLHHIPCASPRGPRRPVHDRSTRFATSIDDAIHSLQTAAYSRDHAGPGYRSHWALTSH